VRDGVVGDQDASCCAINFARSTGSCATPRTPRFLAPARTHITDPDLRGTIKELAQLDGAFVISETGIVVAACRYLDASVEQIDLPLGFGSRHLAAASISQRLGAIAIVVSESGVVRVFHAGQIEATLIPELWLLDRHHTQLSVAAAATVEARPLGAPTCSVSEAGEEP
jgi:DNA integrity scanning protein DisA with diadenylate cyclase activity